MNKLKEHLKNYALMVREHDLEAYAASTTFFIFTTLMPILILLSFLLPHLGISASDMTEMVTKVTPDFVDSFVEQIINEAFTRRAGIAPVMIIVLIWSATKSITVLARGLQEAYDNVGGNIIVLRLMSMIYLAALVAGIAVFTFLRVFGKQLEQWLSIDPGVALGGRYLLFFLLLLVFVVLMYAFVSGVRGNLLGHVPGAVFATVVWIVFTMLFSQYMGHVQTYDMVYGSLATFVVLLMWLYACIYILLIGGTINHYIYITFRRDRKQEDEKAEDM